MNNHRILLLSCVRPSRVWKIANRISRDLPDAEVCGIAQQSMRNLSREQQLIAAGRLDDKPAPHGWLVSRLPLWCRSVVMTGVHLVLWCMHGCPRCVPGFVELSIKKLIGECRKIGWPVHVAENINDTEFMGFVRQQEPELAILLGKGRLTPTLIGLPSRGWISVYHRAIEAGATTDEGLEIRIDYLRRRSVAPFTITSVTLPTQPYDTTAALTLKADLIADDLLTQTITSLLNEDALQTREVVTDCAQKILSPCLRQLRSIGPGTPQQPAVPSRHRPAWKLALETMLFSPFLAGRNWYRRWNGRCPVTILTHHLVSDRPHRMGISTQAFWKQARFLQKHYRIVSLSEATRLLHYGCLKSPTVVLTFDDGYADNFLSLRAVADELGIPVVLFIATDAVDIQQEFEHDLSMGIQGAKPLTWDQIRYWSAQGAEFGSHTRTHFDCGSSDGARLKEEIIGSKADLEAHLGVPIDSFAFPFGWHQNISPESLEIAASSHRYFLSSAGGENLPATAVSGHLLRKGFYSDPWELELDVQGVFELLENGKCKLRGMLQRPTLPDQGFTATAYAAQATSHPLDQDSARSTTRIPVSSFDVSVT